MIAFGLGSVEVAVVDEDAIVDLLHVLQLELTILELLALSLNQKVLLY